MTLLTVKLVEAINLNQAALSWIMPNKFRNGEPMDSTDMAYQHRGHGKYVEIAYLFGWGALSNFWYSVNVDYTHGITYPVNTDPTDSRILRMSKAAGADLRPLFHLWGRPPAYPGSLAASIQNAGLKPSLAIYNRLKYYQSIVPLTLQAFRNHYWAIDSSMPGNDKAWYQDMFNNYTPDIGYASIAQIQNIIDLYFPDGSTPTAKWSGAASSIWNTNSLNWKSIVTGNATNYVDGSPGDSVLFDDTLSANPTISLNTTVTPGGVTFSNNTTYTISGTGQMTGAMNLLKMGMGTVTLNTSNNFTGSVTAGSGTLVLNGVNTCGNTTLSNNAILRYGKTGALGIGKITVGTLQTDTCHLDLANGITVNNVLAFLPRNDANNLAAHFLNLSGTNFLSPPADIPYGTGGNVLSLQANSGRLILTRGVSVSATAPRYVVLQGAGNGEVQGPISLNATLLKLGTGAWTLSGSSPLGYSTVVSNGTLEVNGSLTSTTSQVTIAGGTLSGNGSIAGPVTITSAGRLAPGSLTVNNNLTLEGSVVMKLARAGAMLTNDSVTGITTLSYGGTLVVTNTGSSPLQAGDTFQLFTAASYIGAFANIVYPPGYTFTNRLAVDGTIAVVAAPSTTPPNFLPGGISKLPEGGISLTATSVVGTAFRLWASTNLSLAPITNTWTLLSNGIITASPFTIVDSDATNYPHRFYLFSTP